MTHNIADDFDSIRDRLRDISGEADRSPKCAACEGFGWVQGSIMGMPVYVICTACGNPDGRGQP